MPGRIPHDFIDRLLERVDIVEIIDARVHLKKMGHDYMARCPFHAEKSPSFTVSPTKQFFHCFGCGAHGSAIGFLMDYEHLSFHEAVEELAVKARMDLPKVDASIAYTDENLESSYKILAQADNWFRQQLRTHANAPQAITYLKARGLTGKIAARYGLGYAPANGDELLLALGTNTNAIQLLIKNGLLVEQNGQYRDRFRNRIIFPIRNRRGRTIGFGGRVLGDDKPKYLNSPETHLFHKGQELYGLFEARAALRKIEHLVVVEGYMDVIALAQFDINYTVATLGTSVTEVHLEHLFKVCDCIIFCFDGDRAGRDAAWRAVNLVLPQVREGREIKFLLLPDNDDPDTFIRKNSVVIFEQYIKKALHLSEFIFEHLGSALDLNSLDDRAKLAEQARALLGKLPQGIYRRMMIKKLEQITGIPAVNLDIPQPSLIPNSAFISRARNQQPLNLINRAIALLLQYPQHNSSIIELEQTDWRRLRQPNVTLLANLVDTLKSQPNLTTAALIERWRDTALFDELQKLVLYTLEGSKDNPKAELIGALQRLNTLAKNQDAKPVYANARPSELTNLQKNHLISLLNRNKKN